MLNNFEIYPASPRGFKEWACANMLANTCVT